MFKYGFICRFDNLAVFGGVILELLLIFDAISPSLGTWIGGIGSIYVAILLVLICLRDRWKRTGPTWRESAIMISICTVFVIPILVINLLVNAGLVEPDSPIVIVPIAMFLIVLYSVILIAVYGTRK